MEWRVLPVMSMYSITVHNITHDFIHFWHLSHHKCLRSPTVQSRSRRISDTFHCSHRLDFAFLATLLLFHHWIPRSLIKIIDWKLHLEYLCSCWSGHWKIDTSLKCQEYPLLMFGLRCEKSQDLTRGSSKKIDRSSIFVAFLGTPYSTVSCCNGQNCNSYHFKWCLFQGRNLVVSKCIDLQKTYTTLNSTFRHLKITQLSLLEFWNEDIFHLPIFWNKLELKRWWWFDGSISMPT